MVASEVKQLAAQTARSTEDITRQLGDIQSATEAAVRAVSGMGRAIGEISETAGAIAASVEQQGSATQEIARSVASNGEEVRGMAARIEAVARDAGEAGGQATQVRDETGAVDGSVHALRETLVRVVRTAMTEADRRGERRYPTAGEPCAVVDGGTGRRSEGTLLDVSAHGALAGGATGPGVGGRGTLEIPRLGVRIPFEVREAGMRGLHLRFADEAIGPEYRRAFGALAGVPYPRDGARQAA